tara:strand:+ start:2441 stop:3745 length:1305 start_codon:yes stop_codon:yes gene_type:complete
MVIVETRKKFAQFIDKFNTEDSILIPILSDRILHPVENSISVLYVRFFDDEVYVLPFNHTETINLPVEFIDRLYESNSVKYVYDKKLIGHILSLNNVKDTNLIYYFQTNEPLEFDDDIKCYLFFQRRFEKQRDINPIIPIYKHIEYCDGCSNKMKEVIQTADTKDYFDKYNNNVVNSLGFIEESGLMTTQNKLVFTEYNLYTSTGRPSNRFGGTNFAALDKHDGSRKPYISRFGSDGMLVEFDYEAYHPRLIADIIGYDFPTDISIYEYLGKQYGVDEYDKSKTITFKLLYGGIPDDIAQNIKFFGKVKEYIKNRWNEYKQEFSVESDIYSRELCRKNLGSMSASKLFNYLIQLSETENNMRMLEELVPKIKGNKSKLILYQYDSFLFDFCFDDGVTFLKQVKEIIEQENKFVTKISGGINYNDMKDITKKFVG